MRDFGTNLPPAPERILWLCVLLERFLGLSDFKFVRVLLAGMPSVVHAPVLEGASLALTNLRHMHLGMDTPAGVDRAIDDYLNYHEEHGTQGEYEIEPSTKTFKAIHLFGSERLDRLEAILRAPAPHRPTVTPWADPTREMTARVQQLDGAETIVLDPIHTELPAPEFHDIARHAEASIDIPIDELRAIAAEMDDTDKAAGRERPGAWAKRLAMGRLSACSPEGLSPTATLTLREVRHLIGVPGVGKTSLLMVLAIWLARHGKRAMLVFPTVEVSRQYKSDLAFYGVRAGMLVGQSELTLRRHQERNAETIASQFGNGGFGGKIDATEDFAANCVLRAYSRNRAADWRYGFAPCQAIEQRDDGRSKPVPKLCPVFTACGRKKAARDLVGADIWVGHIRSMDTSLNGYTSQLRMQYFEYIARHFDVVIFDEADKVQADLDAMAATKLQIIGKDGALVNQKIGEIVRMLANPADQRLHHLSSQQFMLAAPTVVSLSSSLSGVLHGMLRHADRKKAVQRFRGQLLTGPKMLIDIMGEFGAKADRELEQGTAPQFARTNAIIELWESVAYTAHMESMQHTVSTWQRAGHVAGAVGLPLDEVERLHRKLHGYLRTYRTCNQVRERQEVLEKIADTMANLCFEGRRPLPVLHAALRLLAPVSLLILAYRDLMRIAPWLPLDPSVIDFADNTMSLTLSRYLPESLAGPLSGLKYDLVPAKNRRDDEYAIELEYATIRRLPRIYMHNFHRLYAAEGPRHGPAVLLMSATSFLEDSPSFHVNCGPHYVLERGDMQHAKPLSEWCFRPVRNPRRHTNGQHYLVYSGGGDERTENLKHMVAGFLHEDINHSEVHKDMQSFDVQVGVPRKAAFVVNSYEQVRIIKSFIDRRYPQFSGRTKAVVDYLREDESSVDYITTAQVEAIGDDASCEIVIFPMAALQRGINIVFTSGPRRTHAAIGHLYFLTRPHPSSDDMQFLLGLIGKTGQEFAQQTFDNRETLETINDLYAAGRKIQNKQVWQILREPLRASRLPPQLYRQFVANLMVMILQTIGRGTRGNCPVRVNFVDAAWAPKSAVGQDDDAKSSMLVMMRCILEDCVNHPDPLHRAIYQVLYGEFLHPMRQIDGLCSAGLDGLGSSDSDDEDFDNYVPEDIE
jgi:hypothetical protein